jgi:hypothetical protein
VASAFTLTGVLLLLCCPAADAECVLLLCAMGALQQKPRAQHVGPFLQHCMTRLQHMSREQLVALLQAMAQLQLSAVDTQVRRVCGQGGF